jgi:hypothetical protein
LHAERLGLFLSGIRVRQGIPVSVLKGDILRNGVVAVKSKFDERVESARGNRSKFP